MGAFFAAIDTEQRRFDHTSTNNLLAALDHFGREGGRSITYANVAIGSRSLPGIDPTSSPQIVDNGSGKLLVFSGRVDNRSSLLHELKQAGSNSVNELSDVEIIFAWIQQYGRHRLQSIIGPFAFVFIDTAAQTVIAARDPMGSRALSYCIADNTLCFASDELAFTGLEHFSWALNDAKVARHLLLMMEDIPESFIDQVFVVKPGELIVYENSAIQRTRFYQPTFNKKIYQSSLAENAKRFRQLFDQAVQRRINVRGTTGIMLSGGLDSVPIAISAKNFSSDTNYNVVAFSWHFPDTPDADETHLSSPLCASLGIDQIKINCDQVSLEINDDFPIDPRIPFSLPFVAYQQATLGQAKALGVPVILSGVHGDLLYVGAQDVVYRALAKGQLGMAVKEFLSLRKLTRSTVTAVKRYLLLPWRPFEFMARFKQRPNPRIKRMLNDSVASTLRRNNHWLLQESKVFPRPAQYRKLFDAFAGEDAMHAKFNEAPYGVERRYPLRDIELCEFVLSVPSEQLYHLGEMRPLLKQAFRGELPIAIANRNDKTLFTKPVLKQIASDERLIDLLRQDGHSWSRYVKESYFDDVDENYELRQLAIWRCAYYNFWTKRVPQNQHHKIVE